MTDEYYITLGIQKILGLQQGENINIGPTAEINPEQMLMKSILDPQSLEIKGKYNIDSRGNEVIQCQNIR